MTTATPFVLIAGGLCFLLVFFVLLFSDMLTPGRGGSPYPDEMIRSDIRFWCFALAVSVAGLLSSINTVFVFVFQVMSVLCAFFAGLFAIRLGVRMSRVGGAR